MDYFTNFFRVNISNVIVYGVLLVTLLLLLKQYSKKGDWTRLLLIGLFCYMGFVLTVTVLPVPFENGIDFTKDVYFNTVPYIDVTTSVAGANQEALLNVLLFVPLGFFLAVLTNKKWVIVLIPLASMAIEFTQLSYSVIFNSHLRIFDITDIINNSLGGLITYLVMQFILFFYRIVFQSEEVRI